MGYIFGTLIMLFVFGSSVGLLYFGYLKQKRRELEFKDKMEAFEDKIKEKALDRNLTVITEGELHD